jgi:hypothetical protein
VRAWREDVSAGLDQLMPDGANTLPASRRARLDNDQCVRGHVPEPFQNRFPDRRRKFIQHIAQADEITRRAIDRPCRDVR